MDFFRDPKRISRVITLDSSDVEQLIKLWIKHNPKDNPEPKSAFSVYVNKELGEINNYVLLFLVKSLVLDNLYKAERFSHKTITLLMEKPVDYLLRHSTQEETETKEPKSKEQKTKETKK